MKLTNLASYTEDLFALKQGFPKCSVRSPRAPQEKLMDSANKEYKQETFYPARGLQRIPSYFDPIKLILKTINYERER